MKILRGWDIPTCVRNAPQKGRNVRHYRDAEIPQHLRGNRIGRDLAVVRRYFGLNREYLHQIDRKNLGLLIIVCRFDIGAIKPFSYQYIKPIESLVCRTITDQSNLVETVLRFVKVNEEIDDRIKVYVYDALHKNSGSF